MRVRATFKYDAPKLKCQHAGFALVLAFQPRDIILEYSSYMNALSLKVHVFKID